MKYKNPEFLMYQCSNDDLAWEHDFPKEIRIDKLLNHDLNCYVTRKVSCEIEETVRTMNDFLIRNIRPLKL